MGKNLLKDLLIQGLPSSFINFWIKSPLSSLYMSLWSNMCFFLLNYSISINATQYFFANVNLVAHILELKSENLLFKLWILPKCFKDYFCPPLFLHDGFSYTKQEYLSLVFMLLSACRGYYRCSTSKGCSAKKQVERCRTDASVLIVTYTSNHNHPGPDLHDSIVNPQPRDPETPPTDLEDHPITPKQEKPEEETGERHDHPIMPSTDEDVSEGHNFHYLESPIRIPQDIMISQDYPFTENSQKCHDTLGIVFDEEPICCSRLMTFSAPKSEENNDFFDDLEELPTSSSFTSFARGNFFDERIPVVPS